MLSGSPTKTRFQGSNQETRSDLMARSSVFDDRCPATSRLKEFIIDIMMHVNMDEDEM